MGYLGLFWYWNWCIIAWLPLSPSPKIYLKVFSSNKLDFFFSYILYIIVKVRCINLICVKFKSKKTYAIHTAFKKPIAILVTVSSYFDLFKRDTYIKTGPQEVAWQLYQQRLVLAPLINKDSIYVLIFN